MMATPFTEGDEVHMDDDRKKAAAARRESRQKGDDWMTWFFEVVPGFAYVLMLYIIGYLVLPSPTAGFKLGPFSITWVEFLYAFAGIIAVRELKRVSYAGVDNTREARLMTALANLQMILWAVATVVTVLHLNGLIVVENVWVRRGAEWVQVFATTQFFILAMLSRVQAWTAIFINAQTLKRTFTTGG